MDFENCVLKVNKTYAAKFERQKERAELDRLQQKYGDANTNEDESSETSESEDEDARELDDVKEKEFLKTLAMIKNKDPQIYNSCSQFYTESDKHDSGEKSAKVKRSDKPVYLKDYERDMLLTKGSKAFIDEESSDNEREPVKGKNPLIYNEEQEEIRKSFNAAVSALDDDNETLLSKRKKSKHEMEVEDKNYSNWLKSRNLDEKDKAELEPLRRLWTDPNLDDDEKFLRNFILEKKYIDRDVDEVPTYNEVVDYFDKEEDELEKQDEFERKYNFRFEEPESSQLRTYPRDVPDSLRRKDNKRKEKREATKERKQKEKEEKKQELKRLKNLKKKEILEKLEKLKEVTGNQNVGFDDEDLDGDFDPVKYDKAMEKAFDDEYYNEEEQEKPQFEDEDWDDYEQENWDEWDGKDSEPHCEDPGFNMDADFEMDVQHEKKGGKKKSAFAEAIYSTKPEFDPGEKTFEEYFDEYYKLDYEDIIGDLPCRFKYRQVEPNDFGLSVDEILKCDDKELNQWASLKRAIQYRTKEEESLDKKRYRKKGKDLKKKMMILTSLCEENNDKSNEEGKTDVTINGIKASDTGENNVNATSIAKHRVEAIAKKIKGTSKWRQISKNSKRNFVEMNQKRRLSRYFRGAKNNHFDKLSSSRLHSYGIDKKKKKTK